MADTPLSNDNTNEPRAIRILSDVAEATYQLRKMDTDEHWSGTGRRHSFENLASGKYILMCEAPSFLNNEGPKIFEIDVGTEQDSFINISFLSQI